MINFIEFLEQKMKKFTPSIKDELSQLDQIEDEEYEDKNWIYNYLNNNIHRKAGFIHSNYEKAMNRKREGSALDFDSFYNYITQDHVHNFQFGESFVFGSYENGIFFPSHFAPKNLKEGVELIKELYKYNVVLFVPEDLSKMAESIGFWKIATNIPTDFRGKKVMKNVLVSNRYIIPKLKQMLNKFNLNFLNRSWP